MTNLLEIKPIIHDFIEDNLDATFEHKVYWIGERKDIPDYPYCLLTELTENKDKRTSRHYGSLTDDMREHITTRYKTAVITVGVYNGWVENSYDEKDMDEAKEFTYEEIDRLEVLFEDYPINSKFSVQNISPIRPLHEPVVGGYEYRYEFDLTIGYNEVVTIEKDYGKGVDVNIDKSIEEDNKDIAFKVTMDGNDNIEIETI